LRKPIHSFHLAEGPGGFIEALANTRNNAHDVYVGITILESGKPADPDMSNKSGVAPGETQQIRTRVEEKRLFFKISPEHSY
jgi:hypothetical protein